MSLFTRKFGCFLFFCVYAAAPLTPHPVENTYEQCAVRGKPGSARLEGTPAKFECLFSHILFLSHWLNVGTDPYWKCDIELPLGGASLTPSAKCGPIRPRTPSQPRRPLPEALTAPTVWNVGKPERRILQVCRKKHPYGTTFYEVAFIPWVACATLLVQLGVRARAWTAAEWILWEPPEKKHWCFRSRTTQFQWTC